MFMMTTIDSSSLKQPAPCDPYIVERLCRELENTLERACTQNMTTPAEVLSSLFTMLSRTLHAMREMETAEDRDHNASEVAKVLNEMLVDYGMKRH